MFATNVLLDGGMHLLTAWVSRYSCFPVRVGNILYNKPSLYPHMVGEGGHSIADL